MQNNASFLGMPEHPCMITRLMDEMREASREFREDPRAFLTGALKGGISAAAGARTSRNWDSQSPFCSMRLRLFQCSSYGRSLTKGRERITVEITRQS